MSNRANHPSERSAVTRLAELRGVAFTVDALRAGERAILVIARDETSARTPGAALAACSSDSTWTLRIGPPLPEPSDLQEMIGAAAGISGVRDMAPLAMAARMLFAEPRRNVILAIDEAHLLSHRSLAYLAEMTELLAPDAPVLQIVLAARPALLDTLAHPEFESFRNRLAEPRCETFLTSAKDASERVVSRPKEPPVGWAPPRPSPVESAEPIAPSPWFYRAAHAAAGLVAAGCLATLGYLALPAFSMDPAPLYALLGSSAPQFGSAPSDRAQSPAQLDSKETDEAVDPLMDQLADAVASGSTESVFPLLERIAKLEARLTPDGLRLLIAMPDRLASRAVAASAAGRIDEARRLEQFYLLADSARRRPDLLSTLNHGSIQALLGDKSGASDVSLVESSTRRSEVGEPRGIPAGGLPIPQQPEAEGDGGRAALSPPAVA
ncbi:MAG TPA: hypothetical protein VEH77_02650, partial [Roseiarcus sp.]|nr:hypothetical protein [Roseiarcus sp.]